MPMKIRYDESSGGVEKSNRTSDEIERRLEETKAEERDAPRAKIK
jgi:hypothetical protein